METRQGRAVVAYDRCVPRPPREEEAGAIHHVFDRGNNHQTIFRDADDRRTFLRLLGDVARERRWNILAFCLLDNHFHLLVETLEPNLGRGMQRILSLYAQIFHARHGSKDALFGRRYGNKRVRDDVYLWTLLSYVAMNPVKAGLCRAPEDWPWGSHASMVAKAPSWLAKDRLLDFLDRFSRSPELVYEALIREASK